MNAKEYQREYHANRYAWLKQHGICVDCACADAAPNRVRCPECAAKVSESNCRRYANMTAEERQRLNAEVRARRRSRVERGLCLICGKPVYAKHSKTLCYEHYLRQLRNHRAYNLRVRLARLETVQIYTPPAPHPTPPDHPWRKANEAMMQRGKVKKND